MSLPKKQQDTIQQQLLQDKIISQIDKHEKEIASLSPKREQPIEVRIKQALRKQPPKPLIPIIENNALPVQQNIVPSNIIKSYNAQLQRENSQYCQGRPRPMHSYTKHQQTFSPLRRKDGDEYQNITAADVNKFGILELQQRNELPKQADLSPILVSQDVLSVQIANQKMNNFSSNENQNVLKQQQIVQIQNLLLERTQAHRIGNHLLVQQLNKQIIQLESLLAQKQFKLKDQFDEFQCAIEESQILEQISQKQRSPAIDPQHETGPFYSTINVNDQQNSFDINNNTKISDDIQFDTQINEDFSKHWYAKDEQLNLDSVMNSNNQLKRIQDPSYVNPFQKEQLLYFNITDYKIPIDDDKILFNVQYKALIQKFYFASSEIQYVFDTAQQYLCDNSVISTYIDGNIVAEYGLRIYFGEINKDDIDITTLFDQLKKVNRVIQKPKEDPTKELDDQLIEQPKILESNNEGSCICIQRFWRFYQQRTSFQQHLKKKLCESELLLQKVSLQLLKEFDNLQTQFPLLDQMYWAEHQASSIILVVVVGDVDDWLFLLADIRVKLLVFGQKQHFDDTLFENMKSLIMLPIPSKENYLNAYQERVFFLNISRQTDQFEKQCILWQLKQNISSIKKQLDQVKSQLPHQLFTFLYSPNQNNCYLFNLLSELQIPCFGSLTQHHQLVNKYSQLMNLQQILDKNQYEGKTTIGYMRPPSFRSAPGSDLFNQQISGRGVQVALQKGPLDVWQTTKSLDIQYFQDYGVLTEEEIVCYLNYFNILAKNPPELSQAVQSCRAASYIHFAQTMSTGYSTPLRNLTEFQTAISQFFGQLFQLLRNDRLYLGFFSVSIVLLKPPNVKPRVLLNQLAPGMVFQLPLTRLPSQLRFYRFGSALLGDNALDIFKELDVPLKFLHSDGSISLACSNKDLSGAAQQMKTALNLIQVKSGTSDAVAAIVAKKQTKSLSECQAMLEALGTAPFVLSAINCLIDELQK